MIEIGLGVVLVLGAVVILAGAGDTLGLSSIDLFPLLGYGGTAFILALGVLLMASGLVRRALKRHHERRHVLRTMRLTTFGVLATASLAVGLPLAAEPFNLVHVNGFPLGYYLVAEAALAGLVVLAFVWAGRQNRIDDEEARHE